MVCAREGSSDHRRGVTPEEAAPPPLVRTRGACDGQMETIGMQAFCELEQCATCPASWIEYDRALLGDRCLERALIERNHSSNRCAEVPLDLLTRVVVAGVIPVEDEIDPATIEVDEPFELLERGSRMPEPNEVGASHHNDVCRARQGSSVRHSQVFNAEPLGTDVDNHPVVPLRQLFQERIYERRTDARAHLAFGRSAQHNRLGAAVSERLTLVGERSAPRARIIPNGVRQRTDIATRVGADVGRHGRCTQVQFDERGWNGCTERDGQVERKRRSARTASATGNGDDATTGDLRTIRGLQWKRLSMRRRACNHASAGPRRHERLMNDLRLAIEWQNWAAAPSPTRVARIWHEQNQRHTGSLELREDSICEAVETPTDDERVDLVGVDEREHLVSSKTLSNDLHVGHHLQRGTQALFELLVSQTERHPETR